MAPERKTKSCLALLILFFLSFFFFSASYAAFLTPDSTPVKQALNYFRACQKEDGGFGKGGITEWVMIAIAAAGQDPRGWYRNGNTPMDYLRGQNITNNPYDWIRMTLVLVSVGENPGDFNGINYIQEIKGHYNDGQFGDPLSLRDDYWALLALVAGGEERSREAKDSAQFILNHQNRDGSWSASTTGIETCADNTAIAIVALSATGLPLESKAFAKGIRYLKKAQGKDGGFSYLFMPSNAASDAWVLQALSVVEKGRSKLKTDTEDVLGHLQKLQQSGGSFNWTTDTSNSPLMMTAYAVPALLGKAYPIRPTSSALVTLGLRIEGEAEPLLDTSITLGPSTFRDITDKEHTVPFPTPLSALMEALKENHMDHAIEGSEMGPYLKSLSGESEGWQYRINDRIPMIPADKYRLNSGDEVIWFYDYHGIKSPLRVRVENPSVWVEEEVVFHIEQFDDSTDQWKPARDACLLLGEARHPASGGIVSIKLLQKGTYSYYAEKKDTIRSIRKAIRVNPARNVKVRLRVEDNGRLLCDEQVSFSGFKTGDINGRTIDIKRPALIGILEAARKKGFLDYQVIKTAEGLILVSINGLEENNLNGSWWYQVNGKRILEDIDEYSLKDGDSACFFRGKEPG